MPRDPKLYQDVRNIIDVAYRHRNSEKYADDHPEDPNGDAEMEYCDDMLDEALDAYYEHRRSLN